MDIKLLIDGVDRTAAMREDGWSVTDNDGDLIDICQVEIEDPELAITITKDKDLIIENSADSTERFFAGIITEIASETLDGIGRIFTVTAQDWKIILDRAHFSLIHVNSNDSAIISASFTEAGITEINVADLVQTGRQIDHLVFRGSTLRLMMDTLVQITGFFWDINKFKKLIYRPYGNATAAFNFSDNPDDSTTFPYYRFFRRESIAQYHRVEIRGGVKLTVVTNQTYSGDGTRKRFALSRDGTYSTGGVGGGPDYPRIFRGPEGSDPDIPTIQRNTGTEGTPTWTTQTVGIEEQDTGKDVLWNPAAHEILWATAPPNFATNSWRITGRALVPAAAIAEDDSAVAVAGRTFTKVIVVPEVEDSDQAADLADAFLRDQGSKDLLSLTFQKDGLVVGDAINVTNAPAVFTAKQFYVHQLRMRQLGGSIFEYTAGLRNKP